MTSCVLGVRSQRAGKLNAKGESRLHVAARLNKVGDVITLLLEGADINATDYAGLSPVYSRSALAVPSFAYRSLSQF